MNCNDLKIKFNCDENCFSDKIFSVHEKGIKFCIVLESDKDEKFFCMKIDNCLIKNNEKKCDFCFLREKNSEFYFVELKGTDISRAYEQIESTINYFKIKIPENFAKEKRFGYIVSKAVPLSSQKLKTLKNNFAKSLGKTLEIVKTPYELKF